MRRIVLPVLTGCVLGLGACTEFPDVAAATSGRAETAPYPDLVPLGPLLARTAAHTSQAAPTTTAEASRVAALRARAARLRAASVIAQSDRDRLDENIDG